MRAVPKFRPVFVMQCRGLSAKSKVVDHYETLGINRDANANEIKTAFYNKSKEYHPDVNQDEEAKGQFQAISDAYEVLGNYELKRNYDRTLLRRPVKPFQHAGDQRPDKSPREPSWEGNADDFDYTEFFRARRADGAYRSRLAEEGYRPPIDRTQQFDYGEFYKSHYADIRKARDLANAKKNAEFSKMHFENPEQVRKIALGFFLFTFAGILFFSDVE